MVQATFGLEDIESVDDINDVDNTNKANQRILVYISASGNIEYQDRGLGLVIENRTSDPGTPANGQIWLRTDL